MPKKTPTKTQVRDATRLSARRQSQIVRAVSKVAGDGVRHILIGQPVTRGMTKWAAPGNQLIVRHEGASVLIELQVETIREVAKVDLDLALAAARELLPLHQIEIRARPSKKAKTV